MTPVLFPLALIGCVPTELPVDPPIGEFIENTYDVAGYEAAGAVGNAPLAANIRAVNQYGASVASEPTGVTVGGTSQTIAFDSLGYGQVRLDTGGTFSIDDGGQVVEAHALDATWPGFGISRAFESALADPEHAVGISTGAVIGSARELWFVGPTTSPHRVLNADGQIRGVQAGHIDVDGVEDVVAWTETTVYLLRGRLGGGLAWGAALTADRHRVGGAAVGELTEDNLPDLVVAWTTDEGPSKLDIWHGNGLFGFTAAEPRNLPAIPTSVSIGDTTGEGKNQITVLSEDGEWARFIQGSDVRYMPIGPRTPEQINVSLGSTVEAWGDINGDGGEEMWFIGPLNAGSTRDVVLVDLVGNKIEFLTLNPPAAHIGRADMDGNGLIDHVELWDSASLRSMSFDETSSNSYTPRQLGDFPAYGPIVTEDIVDHDGIPDLFIADADLWWWWRGHNNPNDSSVFWQIGEQALAEAGTTTGPILAGELDGSGSTTELMTFEDNGGNTDLLIWSWNTATGAASVLGSTTVSNIGVDALDLAACGNDVYVALEGTVVRVDVSNPANPSVQATLSANATAIDCGVAPSGGDAAILEAGSVTVLDAGLNQVSQLTTAGAVDLAIGDIGSGAEVRTCDTAGCSIVFWDDAVAFASSSNAGVAVDDGGLITIAGNGALSVYDVDLDGNRDLIAASDDGRITVHRFNGDAYGFPEIFHTRTIPVGPVAIGDADGDGEPDLWVRDELDRLMYSVAPAYPSDPGTTGGTGSSSGTTR